MVHDLTIPEMGKKPKSVKDMIIDSLVSEHPQTTKKLYNNIRKGYGVSVTFQAVSKSVKSLIDAGALQKDGRDVHINHNWVFRMRDFVDKLLKSAFEAQAQHKQQVGEDIVEYTFDNLLDVDKFVAYATIEWADKLKPGDDKNLVWQGMHCWWLIGQLGNEDWYVEALKKKGVVSFYYNHRNTLLYRDLSKNYYETVGWKFKYSKEKKPNIRHNMAVFGDIILQSYYPEDFAKAIDDFYKRVTDISQMNPAEIVKILRKPRKITLTLLKNPVLAKKIKEEVISKFKR